MLGVKDSGRAPMAWSIRPALRGDHFPVRRRQMTPWGFRSEMPVAHISTDLCVLSVLSYGHFFWGLGTHPALVFVLQIRSLLFSG